jgi:hypothetical protein
MSEESFADNSLQSLKVYVFFNPEQPLYEKNNYNTLSIRSYNEK